MQFRDDETEEVQFTAEEWEIMLNNPAFGYIFRCGHSTEGGRLLGHDCPRCEAMMYEAQYELEGKE